MDDRGFSIVSQKLNGNGSLGRFVESFPCASFLLGYFGGNSEIAKAFVDTYSGKEQTLPPCDFRKGNNVSLDSLAHFLEKRVPEKRFDGDSGVPERTRMSLEDTTGQDYAVRELHALYPGGIY